MERDRQQSEERVREALRRFENADRLWSRRFEGTLASVRRHGDAVLKAQTQFLGTLSGMIETGLNKKGGLDLDSEAPGPLQPLLELRRRAYQAKEVCTHSFIKVVEDAQILDVEEVIAGCREQDREYKAILEELYEESEYWESRWKEHKERFDMAEEDVAKTHTDMWLQLMAAKVVAREYNTAEDDLNLVQDALRRVEEAIQQRCSAKSR